MIGTTISHYRITASLGAGGMGEVWRAQDSTLGREVALKVLPDDFAHDPDRHARFEREAKVLASLNHQNIATLHALEHLDGRHVLVMELVEGEGLDDVIARGPISLDDAVAMALQIAEALEAAHEAGIVHRDLKPANVMVRPDGTVKVLDFGLAKAWETDGGDSSLSLSPTMTRHATAAGVILGTAAYMSPEQARGKKVDHRADIWSFGVVLWEMLTGRAPFRGETVSDVLASVLKESPSLDALPADLPVRLRRLIERCFEKDPRKRLQAIGEARVALEDPVSMDVGEAVAETVHVPGKPSFLPWVIAGLSVALAVAGFFLPWRGAEPAPLLQASLLPPEGTTFFVQGRQPGSLALSPDGRRFVFVARDSEGGIFVWVRSLDSSESRRLDSTEGASYPFWSFDGRNIGFFADGQLKRVPADGGAALPLCEASFGKGGSWSSDGTIIFAPSYNSGIHRVAESGGESVALTTVDAASGENSHRHPEFLPDGHHFLFFVRANSDSSEVRSGVFLGSLDNDEPRPLVVPATGHGLYSDGHLFYAKDNVLFAQPFDAQALQVTGSPAAIMADVETLESASRTFASVSANGQLVCQGRSGYSRRNLVWYDREGRQTGTVGDQSTYYNPRISPDRSRLAVEVEDGRTSNRDIWIYDLERGTSSRFTFERAYDASPVWSPDGTQVAFASRSDQTFDLFVKRVGGTSEATQLLAGKRSMSPTSWSPDGRFLLFDVDQEDIWYLPVDGSDEPYPFVETPKAQWAASFSPDGNWVAYHSMETDDFEIYVASFPDAEIKYQVSIGGGLYPLWNRGGHEIVFITLENEVMAAPINPGTSGLEIGSPEMLFEIPTSTDSEFAADGDRFLVYTVFGELRVAAVTLVSDWHRLLERR